MTELLKQPASSPFPVEREVVSIWAGTTGKLDDSMSPTSARSRPNCTTTSRTTVR